MNIDEVIYKIIGCQNTDTINFFETEYYTLLKFAFFEKTEVILAFLVNKLKIIKYKNINKDTLYKRFYRALRKLEEENLIYTKKEDGFLRYGLTEKGTKFFIYLIKGKQNSNLDTAKGKRLIGGVERLIALHIAKSKKMLEKKDIEEIIDKFEDYLDRIENKLIVLENEEDDKLIFIKYKTRFTSKSRKKELLDKFDRIVKYEEENTKYAVFLTLTTDPKKFGNIIEANKHFQKAFNRFMTYLRKRYEDIRYIASYEFTKKGLLHAHIIIFNKRYLMNVREISKLWDKQGQGKIVWIYQLKNDGNGFVWARKKPNDSKEKKGTDYLKKYIKKNLFEYELDQWAYWLFNKRYYTYSRFYSKILKKTHSKIKRGFKFLTVIDIRKIPGYILKNMIALEEYIREKFRFKKDDDGSEWFGDIIYTDGGKGLIIKDKWSWIL